MPTHNLPSRSTSFVGRRQEIGDIAALLADANCRLLTIVGQGGMGKTRLAVQVADDLAYSFADDVVFVALAPIGSSNLLPFAIADALQISFSGQDKPPIQITHYLQSKQILLVMDNFEHLSDAANFLVEMLHAAPLMKLLVTSRERLNLQEEWVFTLDGLSYPTPAASDPLEHYGAVQLFLQRARQIQPRFSLKENAAAVGAICQQVEGMPLGLELAASWLRVMPCEQIANRMASNLDFLTSPLRNVPERHRSLRNVFEHSWKLLSADEQAVLMRLSVFRGGFDLEAAVDVAGASLPLLAALVDKSLVRVDAKGRYDLHELLRQYAGGELLQTGASDAAKQAHIAYFIQFAEQMEAHLFSREQIVWFDKVETEMDNFRTALARSAETEAGLRLVAALGWFFTERTYWNEGLMWFEKSLAANTEAPAALRAKALHLVGGIVGHMADIPKLVTYCHQSIAVAESIHDTWSVAWALSHLGLYIRTDVEYSIRQLEESVRLFRHLGDQMGLAHTLGRLTWKVMDKKDVDYARRLTEESAHLVNQAGDDISGGWKEFTLGLLSDGQQAKSHFETSIAYFQAARFYDGIHTSLMMLARNEMVAKNYQQAKPYALRALNMNEVSVLDGSRTMQFWAMLAHIAVVAGQYERAACLLAESDDPPLLHLARAEPEIIPYFQDVDSVTATIGEDAFRMAWMAGKAMSRGEAIAYALGETDAPIDRLPTQGLSGSDLSEREREILRLLADGLNSREMAEGLFLSVQTIRWYLKNIYSKLDAHSRSEALARAKSLNLLA